MKKFFFCRAAALLSVSLFLFGCETEVEVPVPGPSKAIICDEVARNLTQFMAYLKDPKISVIGLDGGISLTLWLEVPSGKTLYIVGGYLDTSKCNFTINGIVYVGYGAAFVSADTYGNVFVERGNITVLYGGTLLIKDKERISGRDHLSTALGTNGVTIDGGRLMIEKLWNIAAIEEVFPSVKKGQLVVDELSLRWQIIPSDITKITGISENRMLIVSLTDGKTETEELLSIPEGLTLIIDQDLADVEILEVNGGLVTYADITISETKTLTVNGELVMRPAKTLTVENDVEISGMVTLYKGGKLATTADGTVKFGNTTFSGVGAWTAGATGDNENSTSVSIISGGAEAGVIFSGNASQAGTLTASGTPLITQAAGHNNAFIIYGRVTIDLKGTTTEKSGQITLESGADPGLLAFYDDTSRILADTGDGVNVTLESLTIGGKNVSFPGSNMKVFKKSSSDAHLIRLEFGINPSKWGLISASETPNKNVEINSTAVVATSG